ncbi:MAG TPA: integrin alpha [Solirubrobacteraceae bacterium]|jgi:hypothetical protein
MKIPHALALATAVVLSAGAVPAAAAPLPASGTLDFDTATAKEVTRVTAKAGGFAGRSVAPIGDFNGDGKGDLAIGESQGDTPGREDGGLVHVLLEPAKGGKLEAANAIVIRGAAAADRAGFDIAATGDLNGDGLADLLVGAPLAGPGDPADAPQADGAAYVVFGRRTGTEVDLAAPDFGGVRIVAPGEHSWVGHSVASMPDLDGDGRRELVIGAPKRDSAGRTDSGAVHVVSGNVTGDVNLTQPAPGPRLRIDGPAGTTNGGASAGYAVDSVGDLNGDGLAEVVVGAPRARTGAIGTRANGAAFVVFGSAAGGSVDLEALGAAGYAIRGRANAAGEPREGAGDWFGGAVAGLGDVTGDGKPDLAIGAHLADGPDRAGAGRARVVPGGPTAPAAGAGYAIIGVGAGDATGMAVAPAGDINADGLQDLAVGAPLADPLARTDAGAAYVVFGTKKKAGALDLAEFGTRALRIAGGAPGGTVGFSLAAAGDLDGDGGDDLAIGMPAFKVSDGFGPSTPGPGGLAIAHGAAGAGDLPAGEIKSDPGYQEAIAEGCKPRTNVQAVLEDNGYTEESADPERIRLSGFQDYVSTPRNFGTVLGVTGFGDDGEDEGPTVLAPTELSADEDAGLRSVLGKAITGNDEFPGYSEMFRALADDNPAADARIMVVDGYLFRDVRRIEGLTAGAEPTYIVAIGHPPDRNKADIRQMKLVAKKTKARYYETRNPAELRRALEAIESRLRCDVEVDRFQDELQAGEEEEVADVEIDDDAYSADVTVSWPDGAGKYDFEEVDVLDEDGDVVEELDDEDIEDAEDEEPYADQEDDVEGASASAARRVGLAAAHGNHFRSLHITGLEPGGRLKVTVKAARRKTRGRIVTRVTQSRRRG